MYTIMYIPSFGPSIFAEYTKIYISNIKTMVLAIGNMKDTQRINITYKNTINTSQSHTQQNTRRPATIKLLKFKRKQLISTNSMCVFIRVSTERARGDNKFQKKTKYLLAHITHCSRTLDSVKRKFAIFHFKFLYHPRDLN